MFAVFGKVPYISYFKSVLATSTVRQSTITFTGTFLNGLLGAVFFILAARSLGPAEFGLMGVAITTMTLIADVGNLGTDTGLVNFVARYFKSDPEQSKRFLKLGLEIKVIAGLVILIFGFLLAPFVSEALFKKPELTTILRISFVGVAFFLLFSFITSALQAVERFWTWSGIQIGVNTLRIVILIGVIFSGLKSLENTLWIYIIIPFLGFVIGVFWISPGFLRVKKEWIVAREFFRYNGWVAAFTLMAAVGARLDTFISARLLEANELGIYSAANQMVKIMPMIVSALGTVIAPKMASMASIKEMVVYLKKTQLMVLGLCILGMFAIPIVIFFIPYLFGSEYLASGPIFVVLMLAMLVFLFSVPIHMSIFYYFSYPKLFFWIATSHMILVAVLGWNFVDSFGMIGAAITVLIGQVFNFVIPLVWVLKKVRQ